MSQEGCGPSFLFFIFCRPRRRVVSEREPGLWCDQPARALPSFSKGVFIMNLIDTIKNQLFSDGHINQLGSLIGAGEGSTKSAIGAALPALLAALSNVASTGGGAQKLASAVGRLDAGSLSNTTHMLS